MTNTKIISGMLAGIVLIIGIYMFGVSNRSENLSLGNVVVGGECMSTTTYSRAGTPLFGAMQRIVANTKGTLCSVIITGAVAGSMKFMDATSTTDVSSTTIVVFPASTAAGNYPFNANFFRGLVVETTAALQPTTTITFRNN